MADASERRERAFAPAHVSGIFVPRLDVRDPRGRGSLGAGLVLSAGVRATATFEPGRPTAVEVRGDGRAALPISETVARRLLRRRTGRLTVRLEHDLPIGQGFGSSAAGALATGLAAAAALGAPRSRAVELAHLADLFGGGGLGGVAAILGGGLEVRLVPGIPPYGRVRHRPVEAPVVLGTAGPPIRSPALLARPGALRRFSAGAGLLDRLTGTPSWEGFWSVAEEFTDTVDLGPRAVRDVIRGLRRRGARAAQAMFGSSFFASLPGGAAGDRAARWLVRARVPLWWTAVGPHGARIVGRSLSRAGAGSAERP